MTRTKSKAALPTRRTLRARMKKILCALAEAYPHVECALVFHSPFEILIATILSAQCTDKKVNTVTPELFSRWPDPAALGKARVRSVESVIKTLGLYRNKARNIVACAGDLVALHGGAVPDTMEHLVALPGVGRQTANCVLVNAFGKPGIMCDTHCCRVSTRLGLHRESDPVKIERALGDLMPPSAWGDFSHRIIIHGRQVCSARTPRCGSCCLHAFCEYGKEAVR